MTTNPSALSAPKRTLDDMKNAYSVRARKARVEQGLTEVISDPASLNLLATLMASATERSQARCEASAAA